jgi:hypothetical protein
MTKPLALVAIVLGIVCLGLTVLYWVTAPGALPAFMPGYEQGVAVGHHVKHAVVALVLALALFALAWFQSKPKSA